MTRIGSAGDTTVASSTYLAAGSSTSQIIPPVARSGAALGSDIPAAQVDANAVMSYASNSPFIQPIPADATLDVNSATWAGYVADGTTPQAHLYDVGIAVYTAASGDPTYTVTPHNTTGQGGADWGANPLTAFNPIRIPDTAAPVVGVDGWLVINDPTRGVRYHLWKASKSGGNWLCTWASVYPISSKGDDFLAGSAGTGMAGLSVAAGIVSRAEITAANGMTVAQIARAVPGPVPHALGLVSSLAGNTYRYPATKSDGTNIAAVATPVPAGTRLQLDPSIDISALSGITVGEAAVARALQLYGCYLNDQGGSGTHNGFYFESEDLTDPARSAPTLPGSNYRAGGIYNTAGLTTDYAPLSHIPWESIRALATASVPSTIITPQFFVTDPSEDWDVNAVAQTTHPAMSGNNTTALAAGVLTVARWKARRADYFSKCDAFVIVAAATGISNCYIAVYSSTGTLIGVTADQSTAWSSTGGKLGVSLGVVHPVEPGDWGYVALLIGAATTKPVFCGLATNSKSQIINGQGGTTNYGTAGTGLTAMPGTLPTLTAGANAVWVRLTH